MNLFHCTLPHLTLDFCYYTVMNFSRSLSTMNHSVPLAANFTAVSKSESREFMSVFPGNTCEVEIHCRNKLS